MNEFAAPNIYDDDESLELIRQHIERKRSLGALSISRAAAKEGAELDWLSPREVWATLDDRRIPINGHYGPESPVATGIVADKELAKKLMMAEGTSVPAGRRVTSVDDAIRLQQEIGRPVVIKPVNGAMGRGVTVNISTPDEIRAGYLRALRCGSRVLVEQYVKGNSEYRAHATENECVGLFRRIIPSVTGDGISSVRTLVERKNDLRGHNPTTAAFRIKMDDVAEGTIRRQSHTWESVPLRGEVVTMREVNGITSGGDSEECLDTAPAALKQTAVSAVRAIPGMTWGGVDILVEEETGIPYVLEANGDASINGSNFPVFGTPRDLGPRLWREIVEHSVPELQIEPVALPPLGDAYTIGSALDALSPDELSLQQYLMIILQMRGYRTTSFNEYVWAAETANGQPLWFSSVLSGADVARAIHPLRRTAALRQALQKNSLPRPYGRKVSSVEQLRTFRAKVGDAVALLPLKKGLGCGVSTLIGPRDEIPAGIFSKRSTWYALSYRPGLRFRVAASREKALTVMVPNGQQASSADIMRRVTQLAVRAVRALPQLRWGIVDIVDQSATNESSRRLDTVVEGITLNPVISASDRVVAGSMDDLIKLIVDGARSASQS